MATSLMAWLHFIQSSIVGFSFWVSSAAWCSNSAMFFHHHEAHLFTSMSAKGTVALDEKQYRKPLSWIVPRANRHKKPPPPKKQPSRISLTTDVNCDPICFFFAASFFLIMMITFRTKHGPATHKKKHSSAAYSFFLAFVGPVLFLCRLTFEAFGHLVQKTSVVLEDAVDLRRHAEAGGRRHAVATSHRGCVVAPGVSHLSGDVFHRVAQIDPLRDRGRGVARFPNASCPLSLSLFHNAHKTPSSPKKGVRDR